MAVAMPRMPPRSARNLRPCLDDTTRNLSWMTDLTDFVAELLVFIARFGVRNVNGLVAQNIGVDASPYLGRKQQQRRLCGVGREPVNM